MGHNVVKSLVMRTTLDIPDAMYRRIKTRTAQEGSTVRGITLILYAQWLDGGVTPKPPVVKPIRKRPAWFGSVKVDGDLPHDMASVRKSIAAHCGD